MHTSQSKSAPGMSDSDTGRSSTHEIKHDLKKDVAAVRHGKESATDMARSAREGVREYHESMCDSIKKNPTTAVLLAVGLGVIAGRLLPRR